jgi:hypothetical protein
VQEPLTGRGVLSAQMAGRATCCSVCLEGGAVNDLRQPHCASFEPQEESLLRHPE